MRTITIIFIVSIFGYLSCNNSPVTPTSENEIFITQFDMNKMHKIHLPDFELARKGARYNEGREFVFRDTNHHVIFIRIGIHSSKSKVEKIAKELNSCCSIIPQEDSQHILGLGERAWSEPGINSSNPTGYRFIRNNVFVWINSHTYTHLLELAQAIDADMVDGAHYIKKSHSIVLPVIHSIQVQKKELKEGDRTLITVNASDSKNEELEYVFDHGLFHAEMDPNNVFVLKAERDFVPEPFFGRHVYKFIVCNESNVVSKAKEFEISIIESP